MAEVGFSRAAVDDLDRLVVTHSLPADTRARVRRSLAPLRRFPRLGRELGGRWGSLRFVLGPWRWMVIVYSFDESSDTVVIVAVHDGRSSAAARPAPAAT